MGRGQLLDDLINGVEGEEGDGEDQKMTKANRDSLDAIVGESSEGKWLRCLASFCFHQLILAFNIRYYDGSDKTGQ